MSNYNGFKSFLRSAYLIKQRFEDKTVTLQIPAKNKERKNSIIMSLLPVLMSVGMMLFCSLIYGAISGKNGTMNMGTYFIFMIASAVSGVIVQIIQKKQRKKDEEEQLEEWISEFDETVKRTESEYADRLGYLKKCYISDSRKMLDTAVSVSPYLWNVTDTHYDFLHSQMGRADVPSGISIAVEGKIKDLDESLQRKVKGFIDASSSFKDAPFSIDLSGCPAIGVFGHKRRAFLTSMITGLCIRHGYDLLKCVLICNNDNYVHYQWMRWLPHMWDDTRCDRYIRLSSRRQAYFESIFDAELIKAQDGYFSPFYVFVVDEDKSIFGTALTKTMRKMIETGHAAAIVICEKERDIPQFCVAKVDAEAEEMCFYSENSPKGISFKIDEVSEVEREKITRYLSRINLIDSGSGSRIPTKIGFNEMLQKDFSLKDNIMGNWNAASNPSEIKCLLGVVEDSAPFEVPIGKIKHAILAGKTGSGKSQFLMAFITYLMIKYPPSFVQFLFIDFKGNALADNFKHTTHCAGSFSNLDRGDDSGINRIREMLNAEIKRREELIAASTAKIRDIENYNYTAEVQRSKKFLPHLFVVVDEYVELLSQHSEFVTDFERFCRVGRSLGIHLVLASQRLDGKVTDQVKTNVDVFICFKVNDAEECKNVIKVSGAENIKVQGRGYARVESDVREFQAPWIEKPYIPFAINENGVLYEVRPDGRRGELNRSEAADDRTELNAITATLEEMRAGGQNKIFSDQLANAYYWNEEQIAVSSKMRGRWNNIVAMIGSSDDFYEHRHSPATLQLTGNNYFVAGATKRGKTTTLQSIVFSVCQFFGPERVNFYICEMYAKSFKPFERLPQVHEIIDSSEQLFRLMMHLEAEIKRRKGLLGETYASVEEYNSQNEENRIPEIMVVIDDVDNLIADYNMIEDKIEALISSNCTRYGITFIVSLSRYTELRRFLRSFEKKIVMHYNENAAEELMDAPRSVSLQNIPGRCFTVNNGRILQTQIFGFYAPTGTTLKASVENMIDSYLKTLPEDERENTVHKIIKKVEVNSIDELFAQSRMQDDIIPLFVDNVQNTPIFLNQRSLNSLLVFGDYNICTRYTRTLIEALRKVNAEIHVIDISCDLGLVSDYANGLFVYDISDINLLIANIGIRSSTDVPRVFITYGLAELQSKLENSAPGTFDTIDRALEDIYNNGSRSNQYWISVDASHNNFFNDRSNSLNYTKCGRAVVLSPKYIVIGEAFNFGRSVPSILDIDYNDCELPQNQAWLCLRNSYRRVVIPEN